jgi:hypothetical protein
MGGLASAASGAFGEAEGAGGFARGCSFSADTTVAMADGTSEPISKLRPGDLVEAYDPATGKTGPHTVTAVMVNRDPATEHLVLDWFICITGAHTQVRPAVRDPAVTCLAAHRRQPA